MVRPGWGATGSSGRELTRGRYALKHKYHLPCPPPPCCNFFCQHTCCKNVYRDEGVILSHICWDPGAPLLFSRPQTPPLPPQDPAPPRPGIGWKVGGSRRMARCYATPPPPVVMQKTCFATFAVCSAKCSHNASFQPMSTSSWAATSSASTSEALAPN